MDEVIQFVRSLRGAAASIYVALEITRRAMTNTELQDYTDYSEKTVQAGIRKLVSLDLITSPGKSGLWSLAPGADLGFGSLLATSVDSGPDSGIDAARSGNSGGHSGISGLSSTRSRLVVPAPEPLKKALELVPPLEPEQEPDAAETTEPHPEFPEARPKRAHRSPESTDRAKSSPGRAPASAWDLAANLKALREADIHEPAASRLAALKHVTPNFVREQVKNTLAEHKGIGAAIFRIEHNWRLPANDVKADFPPILINPEEPRPEGHPAEPIDPTIWNFDENVYALLQYRGAEDVAKRVAALRHVTPPFIHEHMRQAAEHGQDVITALYRIEHNERFPNEWMGGSGGKESSQAEIRQLARRLETAQKQPR